MDERFKKKRIICIYMLFRVTGMEEKKKRTLRSECLNIDHL